MYKIGLSGGICTGKSVILNVFKELGSYTLRADDIAKNIIFSHNSEILPQIVDVFGKEILDEKNGIDKKKFSTALFEDSDKRIFLNNLVHPLVKAERINVIKSVEEAGVYEFLVYESALLVEAGIYKEFDKVIIAYTTPEEQIQRLIQRDELSREDAESRLRSQFPLSEKLKVAQYAIDTTGTIEQTKRKTLETFYLIKKDLNIKQ